MRSIRPQVRTAAGLALSVAILIAAILAAYFYGLDVRTIYGSGISPALGDKIVRDFLADQDAEASALSLSDETLLNNRLSDAALSDVVGQIHEAGIGQNQTFSFQPSSMTVLHSQDPNDPSLLLEVQERGVRSVTTTTGPNSAPTQDQVTFQGNFWLRQNADGHYLIADQKIENLPNSYTQAIALGTAGFVWLGLASVLVRRTRLKASHALPELETPQPLIELPEAAETADLEPTAKVVIRTFGGLQVLEDGTDWAPALKGRPLMSFVWQRVLLAAIEERVLTRDEVGRQASPGLDRETQLKRLRNLLYKGLPELPEPLRDRLVVEPKVLRFNLADCWVDAIDLTRVSAECSQQKLLRGDQLGRVRRILDSSHGVAMPEFDAVEELATDDHRTCRELLTRVRELLTTEKLALLALLANTYVAAGQPERAIQVLEPTLHEHPERKEVAAWLSDARRAAVQNANRREPGDAGRSARRAS